MNNRLGYLEQFIIIIEILQKVSNKKIDKFDEKVIDTQRR